MTADEHDHGWRGRWPGRVLRFPLTRIVLGFLAIIVVGNLARVLLGPLYEGLGLGPWRATSLATAITLAVVAHLAYLGYVRFVEQRRAAELAWAGAPKELGHGPRPALRRRLRPGRLRIRGHAVPGRGRRPPRPRAPPRPLRTAVLAAMADVVDSRLDSASDTKIQYCQLA